MQYHVKRCILTFLVAEVLIIILCFMDVCRR